jgi:hypothetical protein
VLVDFLAGGLDRKWTSGNKGRASISCRALVIAASCRTWFMTATLGSEEAEKPRLLLTLSILSANLVCGPRTKSEIDLNGLPNGLKEDECQVSCEELPLQSVRLELPSELFGDVARRLINKVSNIAPESKAQTALRESLQTVLQKGQLTNCRIQFEKRCAALLFRFPFLWCVLLNLVLWATTSLYFSESPHCQGPEIDNVAFFLAFRLVAGSLCLSWYCLCGRE